MFRVALGTASLALALAWVPAPAGAGPMDSPCEQAIDSLQSDGAGGGDASDEASNPSPIQKHTPYTGFLFPVQGLGIYEDSTDAYSFRSDEFESVLVDVTADAYLQASVMVIDPQGMMYSIPPRSAGNVYDPTSLLTERFQMQFPAQAGMWTLVIETQAINVGPGVQCPLAPVAFGSAGGSMRNYALIVDGCTPNC